MENNNRDCESEIVCFEYDDVSIRLWYRNHDVVEYTVEDVGPNALSEMIRLAIEGRGLVNYISKSRAIQAAQPHRWKEWLARS